MLETIIVVLIVLWLLGIGIHVAGALVHILLIVALVLIVIRLLNGRGPTTRA